MFPTRLVVGIMLAWPVLAFAQSIGTDAGSPAGASTPARDGSVSRLDVRQLLQDQFAHQGYRDIRIAPASFIVRAFDRHGDPVVLVLGPGSVTEVTEVEPEQASVPNTHPTPANATSMTSTSTER